MSDRHPKCLGCDKPADPRWFYCGYPCCDGCAPDPGVKSVRLDAVIEGMGPTEVIPIGDLDPRTSYTVELVETVDGKHFIRAHTDTDFTEVDLERFIAWLRDVRPDLLEG